MAQAERWWPGLGQWDRDVLLFSAFPVFHPKSKLSLTTKLPETAFFTIHSPSPPKPYRHTCGHYGTETVLNPSHLHLLQTTEHFLSDLCHIFKTADHPVPASNPLLHLLKYFHPSCSSLCWSFSPSQEPLEDSHASEA